MVGRAAVLGVLVGLAIVGAPGPAVSKMPVPAIFDTDIGPDVDDAGTMGVLHALADRGEVRILGMGCCTSNEGGAACLDALNTWYGRPDLPVGTWKGTGFLTDSKYAGEVARRFPNDLRSGKNAPDAATLYRHLLARQPRRSVVMVAVGPLNNMKKLLDSGPDDVSSLDGRRLVAEKVRLLSIMGGRYPQGKEWNFEQDPAAAARVVSDWPTSLRFSGGEIGERVFTGKRLTAETPEANPVRAAYTLYVGAGKDRESWDLTAMLAAVRGPGDFWGVRTTGYNTVDPKTGANRWMTDRDRDHEYLIEQAPVEHVGRELDDLMTAPPRVTGSRQQGSGLRGR